MRKLNSHLNYTLADFEFYHILSRELILFYSYFNFKFKVSQLKLVLKKEQQILQRRQIKGVFKLLKHLHI